MCYHKMITLIKDTLPSGLVQMRIGDECWTQRIVYPIVATGKSVKSPPKPIIQSSHSKPRKSTSSIFRQLLPHVDDTFDLYTHERKESAERVLIDHLKTFVGNNPGRELMGSKASQEILKFLGDKYRRFPPESFMMLCSFLFDASLQVDDKVFTHDSVTVTRTIKLQCKN